MANAGNETSVPSLPPVFAALGMTYPILQAPTGSITGPEVAVAVASAGGMGAIAPYRGAPEAAAEQARQVRAKTSGAFQANFALMIPPHNLTAVLEAGVPVITFSWGDPKPYMAQTQAAGAKIGIQVTNVTGAQYALDLGADFLICQGIEAGGHVQSFTPLWELLPSIVAEARGVPVVAAGGIGDGAGIAKALALGAAGAMLGTRFVATQESRAHPLYKQSLIEARAADSALTLCFDGEWPQAAHRVVRNATLDNWEAAGSPIAGQRPGEGETVAYTKDGRSIGRYHYAAPHAEMTGNILAMCLYAGTSCGSVQDIPPAAELVVRLWSECLAAREQTT